MKQKIFVISLFIFLNSCEKSTSVSFQFKNFSTSSIIISGHDIIHDKVIQDTILVGAEKNVAMWSKLGKDLSYFSPLAIFGDDLLVLNAQGDTLIKDYKNLDNWQIMIDEARTVATHHYLFEIQETDFN
jgi:hypothetical protein